MPASGARCAGRSVALDSLVNIDFTSASTGVALVSPAAAVCPSHLAVTTDAGSSWRGEGGTLPDPEVFGSLATMSFSSLTAGFLVSAGRVEVTADGGRTWRRALAGRYVDAVAAEGRSVWLVDSRCLPGETAPRCGAELESTTPSWRRVTALGRAPRGLENYGTEVMVRLSSTSGAIALGQAGPDQLFIATTGGATRTARWVAVTPCADGYAPVSFARSPGGRVFLVCIGGSVYGRIPKSLELSRDGGRRWRTVAIDRGLEHGARSPVPAATLHTVTAASASRLVLVENTGVWVSTDSGRTWTRVPALSVRGGDALATVSFGSPDDGYVLVPGQGLWRTTDLRSWSRV